MLKDVIDLGGTQEDYDMLHNVSDNEKELVVDGGDSDFNVAELITFMKSNGMKTVKKSKAKGKPTVSSEESKEEIDKRVTPKICPVVPSNPPPHDRLIFKANEPWYTNVPVKKADVLYTGIEKWKRYAEQLWKNEVELSSELRDKHQASDQQWMQTIFTSGTINDKVSAHCLLLQESPVHHIKSLDALLGMAKKKSKRMAIQSIDTLKEMFLSTILPENRKLFTFEQHDFSALTGETINVTVLGWLVEDKLKSCYSEYLDVIKTHLNDNEVAIRTKLCNLVSHMLNEKPEKEQELLAILVNKIGDPDNKLASKIIYILTKLLQNHPSMKKVVASEVERVLFRPNIAEKAQYYSICFLNQLQLTPEDSAFAAHLIEIYFKFFKESIDNTNVDTRMLGGLLTGVNRAYPYTASQDAITGDNVDTLFKLVYSDNFNVSIQALMLLYQVSGSKSDICNRYYQALYAKLVDSSISTSSKKSFLLNLIYKSLKRDSSVARKVAISRRLLQVSNLDEPFLACASLYTISEANKNSTSNIEPTDKNPKDSDLEQSESKPPKSDSYSAAIRNPLYSNADRQDLWEFSLLSRNFHPSVNEFVSSLLVDGEVSYSGDPFNDFTRIKFLDKFVFKNPKSGVKASNKKFYSRNQVDSNQPQVYSSEFKEQKASKVSADERFFFEYFKAQKISAKVEDTDEKEDTATETDALDFADDIKFASTSTTKEDKKKKKSEGDDEDDGDESDSGSDFSYGDIDDDEDCGTVQVNDKAYEKFLWENLNSDGESIQGSDEEDGEEKVGSNVAGGAQEDEWEDLDVAESDEEMEAEGMIGGADSEFMDADNVMSVIMEHKKKNKKKNKKKRSNSSLSDEETKSSKKTKTKTSDKFKKSKSKKLKSV
ncbi:CCAAT/enhancer-binding protein zeta-like [Bolinopsis microptera]|uniref:CCAAT/enhancer-binding protein zeta-like n=1 Tax=Bolinopsis microptera TaxID=2820187 RepID=UPI00307B0D0E